MKLILSQEVEGLGAPGDIVEVKDGYGRNFLMPRGLAIRWTKGGEKQIASIRKAREVREIRDIGQAKVVKGQLEGLKVTLSARSGSAGRLFGRRSDFLRQGIHEIRARLDGRSRLVAVGRRRFRRFLRPACRPHTVR
jgi:ribosomal protein L9